MHKKILDLLFLIPFLCAATSTSAQMERTMYQVFEVDSFKLLRLDLADVYEIETWGGSSVLIETNIKISHASPEILDQLIKDGRYDVKADTISPTELLLVTKHRERRKIKTPRGECTEIPAAKVFVPDTFIWTSDQRTVSRKN